MKIIINNTETQVEEGMTILEALRANGLNVPTLCYHPALKPSGACKLCAVEVTRPSGRESIVLSCVMKVKEGMIVKTQGEAVENARTGAFNHLLQMAPQSKRIIALAEQYGVSLGPPPDGCIRCMLCVHVCQEIVRAGALKMEKRDGIHFVVPIQGSCIGCGTCVNICPTGAIQLEDHENVRTIRIRDEVIGRHPLETCEGCGKRFATPRYLEYIEQRTSPHPHVKEEHHYCPTCAKLFSNRVKSFSRQSRVR
jgi:predicted molibdopterin-dependent oxidoreductase YjgC